MKKSIEQRNIEIFPTITERVNKLYDAYLLDLDGTVLLGNNLIPGAEKVIKMLRDLDKRVIFISNNSTSSASSYADQLTSLGVPTQNYDVINSSQVLINFLNKNLPQGRLLVLGEPELCGDLESNGFHVTDNDSDVDAVIASFDRSFNYQKLQAAFDAIKNGARFYATNSDKYRPLKNGGQPDAGHRPHASDRLRPRLLHRPSCPCQRAQPAGGSPDPRGDHGRGVRPQRQGGSDGLMPVV